MSKVFYVPGTDETDIKKVILSLQNIAAYLTKANFEFPATQNDSSDPNTLDDYEEGTWTPVLTFVTPGDLDVAYTTQYGAYTKIGNLVLAVCGIVTSSFTHSTASGVLRVTGLPFPAASEHAKSSVTWRGITKANYTDVAASPSAASSTAVQFNICGSGQAATSVQASDMPTGGSVILQFSLPYTVAA